jgi:polyphosphate kinase
MYEDYGLLTAHEGIGEDVAHLFNNLSGFSRNASYEHLMVAPDGVREGLLEKIRAEVEHHAAGAPARIRIKANSIVDERVIDELYRASMAGVPVDLLTRGICSARPGVPGLSDNLRVRSILGRFLEHSRVFWFENGGSPSAWIGSADLMHRNLDRRVECLVELPGQAQIDEVGRLLDLAFDEGTASWWLTSSGDWERHHLDADGAPLVDLQDRLIAWNRRRRRTRPIPDPTPPED